MHELNKASENRQHLLEILSDVKCLAIDIDGVLTDGSIVLDNSIAKALDAEAVNREALSDRSESAGNEACSGTEQKSFHVSDGLGLVLLIRMGFQIVWISGRASKSVERRAKELGVENLLQGVRDKRLALQIYENQKSLTAGQVAYIGDDWNDLPAFDAAGVRIAVANAADEVKAAADYVTLASGGRGAVREVCMLLLEAHGLRERCLEEYLISLSNSGTPAPGQ